MKHDRYKCADCGYVIEIPEGSYKPFCRHCGLTMDLVKPKLKKKK